MTLEQATALLSTSQIDFTRSQVWCDLGCGEGLFTKALANHLQPGSVIHAIDVNHSVLEKLPDRHNGVMIRKIAADLTSTTLRLPSVDGFLMANFLHFMRDQSGLLGRLKGLSDCFLIVEYERSRKSIWDPYPVSFQHLCSLLKAIGMQEVQQIASRKSSFGGEMYAALALRHDGKPAS